MQVATQMVFCAVLMSFLGCFGSSQTETKKPSKASIPLKPAAIGEKVNQPQSDSYTDQLKQEWNRSSSMEKSLIKVIPASLVAYFTQKISGSKENALMGNTLPALHLWTFLDSREYMQKEGRSGFLNGLLGAGYLATGIANQQPVNTSLGLTHLQNSLLDSTLGENLLNHWEIPSRYGQTVLRGTFVASEFLMWLGYTMVNQNKWSEHPGRMEQLAKGLGTKAVYQSPDVILTGIKALMPELDTTGVKHLLQFGIGLVYVMGGMAMQRNHQDKPLMWQPMMTAGASHMAGSIFGYLNEKQVPQALTGGLATVFTGAALLATRANDPNKPLMEGLYFESLLQGLFGVSQTTQSVLGL